MASICFSTQVSALSSIVLNVLEQIGTHDFGVTFYSFFLLFLISLLLFVALATWLHKS